MNAITSDWRAKAANQTRLAFGQALLELGAREPRTVVVSVDTLDALPLNAERPTAIIAHTVKGKGVSFAENTYVWHSNSVTDEIYASAIAELAP